MKLKVAILSAGLGNVSRGFETSAAIWASALRGHRDLDVSLFAGGNHLNAKKTWCIPRTGLISRILKKVGFIKDGCRLEQLSFSIGFLFHLITYKPNVIWLQEGSLALMLLKFRKIFFFNYKIIFCDGAPLGHHFAKQFDHIVFLHKYAYREAVNDGLPPAKMTVIPHLSIFPNEPREKNKIRKKLNIPSDKFVILCVAAWNTHHKRIDYLLKEVGKLERDNLFLILCGQPEAETEKLKTLGKQLNINARWLTLPPSEMSDIYSSADLFVLPSISEALGAVLIEAAFHDLPVIAHPHAGGLSILGEEYHGLTDLSVEGALADKIKHFQNINFESDGKSLGKRVREEFDNKKLTNTFIDLIFKVNNKTNV